MRDVADRAGVGMMTVSRVLNGTARVSEETSRRVYSALEELNYRPNHLARALRGFRSNSIGLIVPYLYDPFFASCAHAISAVARQHACSVLLTTTNESPEAELEECRQLLRRQIDGLILIPAGSGRSLLGSPEFAGTPIVAIDRPVPRSRFDRVLVQNQQGACQAVQHLIEHGHRRICFIGLRPEVYTIQTRLAGYEQAIEAAGLKSETFFHGEDAQATFEFLRQLHARRDGPTAIFAANGLSSRHALHAIGLLGISVPDQMAFIGFDDFELADVLHPALSVVRQPVERIGQEAAEMLFARLAGDTSSSSQPRKLMLPVELVLRRSCGCHNDHP
jgi:LacI family transcriptional regulator